MDGVSRIFRCCGVLGASGLLLVTATVSAQNVPPRTVDEALHQMSDEAGVIFAGQVMAVHRLAGDNGASGVVEVEFRVDQAVRGCAAGEPYVLREWAGLWAGGARRYRVGERLLMFLRTPSASGLSSPVDGMDGAVPILGSSSPLVAGGVTVQSPVADLRWVATQVYHPVVYRAESAHPDHRKDTLLPLAAHAMVRGVAHGTTENATILVELKQGSVGASTASVAGQQASVQSVIAMLKSWQKVSDAVR